MNEETVYDSVIDEEVKAQTDDMGKHTDNDSYDVVPTDNASADVANGQDDSEDKTKTIVKAVAIGAAAGVAIWEGSKRIRKFVENHMNKRIERKRQKLEEQLEKLNKKKSAMDAEDEVEIVDENE